MKLTTTAMYQKVITYFERVGQFWWWVWRQFVQDGCVIRASALTYTSLLALAPLMVVFFSALRLFPAFKDAPTRLQHFVFSNFVPHTGQVVLSYLLQLEQQAGKLPMISVIFLVITAILMLLTLERTLNQVWKVQGRRSLRGSLLMYWAFLTIGPLIMGLGMLVSSYLLSLHWFAGGIQLVGMSRLLAILPFCFTVIGFTFVYLVVPNCPVRVWDAFRGALAGAILFEIAREIFSYYVVIFPTYQLFYGALAAIPLFLIWVYVSWVVFLFGAEIVNALRLGQSRRSEKSVSLFILGYRLLHYIWYCQQHNQRCSFVTLTRHEQTCPISEIHDVLERMEVLNIIHCDEAQSYLIKMDLNQLTLYQFAEKMAVYIPKCIEDKTVASQEKALNVLLKKYHAHAESALDQSLANCFK